MLFALCMALASPFPRESRLTMTDFIDKYSATSTPVVVTDYQHAFDGVDERSLARECGDKLVSVARRTTKAVWAGIEWVRNGTLHEALRDPSKNGTSMGVFDWSLPRHCPEIMLHWVTPKYFAQNFVHRIDPAKPVQYRDAWPSLFVGADGTYSDMHRDVFGSAFWQYVVRGAKEWHAIASPEGLDMYNGSAMRHYHDVIRPGELLILPGNIWHQVRNHGNTVSYAGNFVTEGGLDEMRKEIEGKNFKYYNQVREILEPAFDTKVDRDAGDSHGH